MRKYLKSTLALLVMAAFVTVGFFLFTGQTNNGKQPFRNYHDGSVSWFDSLGNIDSLNYPYYLNGGKFEDFSLINGQTINYRVSYVTASTNDTVFIIAETKTEGVNTLTVDCDSIRLPGTTTVTISTGTFSFSSTTAQNWRFRITQATSGGGTANRNNGYVLLTVWSNTINTVPSRFRLGNY
jgi:hypothetical protein